MKIRTTSAIFLSSVQKTVCKRLDQREASGNSMQSRLASAALIVRWMGIPWVAYRALRVVESRARVLERRVPSARWESFTGRSRVSAPSLGPALRDRIPLRKNAEALRAHIEAEPTEVTEQIKEQVAAVLGGDQCLFSGQAMPIGWPPEWHLNAAGGSRPPAEHFSKLSAFAFGDIKNVWEPGRFTFVFPLIRAFARNQCEDAADRFWTALDDFMQRNPAFAGPQWMCGQEVALRVFALVVGWSAFAGEPASTDERLANLWRILAASGERIEGDIRYALSQKNNHGISEAAGLLILGIVLPEHRRSAAWLERGRTLLDRQVNELVYSDGAFSQHSANYHRVVLQVLTFVIAVSKQHGVDLPDVRAALRRALSFMRAIQDDASGRVPRYGHDDGALVFPWTSCPYDDFRPAVQEAAAVLGQPLPWPPGAWDEGICWLGFAPTLAERDVTRPATVTLLEPGGMAVLRSENSMACLRVPRPRHRPSHLDALHADLWWKGHNIAIDLGTYRYNASPPWDALPLARGPAHNLITPRGGDQARSVGRFLFLPWPRTRVLRRASGFVEAELEGPMGCIQQWSRSLMSLPDDAWCVVDQVTMAPRSTMQLHWHLAAFPDITGDNGFTKTLQTPDGDYAMAVAFENAASEPSVEWYFGEEEGTRGWYAPRYGALAPCHEAIFTVEGQAVTCVTLFAPGAAHVSPDRHGWKLSWNEHHIQLPFADAGATTTI